MGSTNHILVVEDHPSLRGALASMLNREPGFAVVGEVGTIAEARGMLRGVDVAIIDLSLPDGSGVDLIGELREVNARGGEHKGATLVLTASMDRVELARAVEAGAAGVLHKSAPISEIVDAVRRLCAGEALLSPAEIAELLHLAATRRERGEAARSVMESLTTREQEVVQALADGSSDREIAQQLGIALETERTYVANILAKLKVNSRLQVVAFAIRHGLVDIYDNSSLDEK